MTRQRVICLAIAGFFGLPAHALAASHAITCDGSTSGQLSTLLEGGTVVPGDTVLIKGFCVGDVYLPGGIRLTNHGNTSATVTTDGIQGQVTVNSSPYGQAFINGLTLKGFGTDTGESSNVYAGPGGEVVVSFANITAAQQDGIEIDGGNVELESSKIVGNGLALSAFHDNGIRIHEGGSLLDSGGASTISANKGYGICLEGGYVKLASTNFANDAQGEVFEQKGASSFVFNNGSIKTVAAFPAIRLLSGATATLSKASITGTRGALLVSGGSGVTSMGSTFTSSAAAVPVIAAQSASSITLAGGNTVTNSATGGTAVLVTGNSSLAQVLGTSISSSFTNAVDTVTGLGTASANSSLDLGQGVINTNPSLTWNGDLAVSLNSFVRMSGGVTVSGSLALSGNSGADFLVTNGGSNSVIAGVTCPTAGTTVTSYVTNPTNVSPTVTIGSTKPACLQN